MWKPISVLILLVFLLTACSPSSPTVVPTEIPELDRSGTVKQDTSCYLGPGPGFGIAVELNKDLRISIVGASEGGEYVVINDPENKARICWADFKDIGISSEELMMEFMKLNTQDPDSSDFQSVTTINLMVRYKCISDSSDKPGSNDWAAEAAEGESAGEAPPTLTTDQALHKSCNDALGIFGCHSAATIEQSIIDCGELVYPAYYIPQDESAGKSTSNFSTSPPVEFIPCTPKPIQQPAMILDLVLCWNGPGPGYEVISSLQPNTPVEVLGVGLGGDFIVITNPRYDRPCWVKETDIELYELNLTGLPILGIPEQDASANSSDSPDSPDSSMLGCLVGGGATTAPTCIKPCPDPVAYPQTCEP